mmetsp:Transcript_5209/g.15840  ORF Transcript_5209/g.15840 Transcript_5209/m.15840 type:complete len:206 (+) Transcript_5209:23-640(+)
MEVLDKLDEATLRAVLELVSEASSEAADAKARYREAMAVVEEMRAGTERGDLDEMIDLLETENAQLRARDQTLQSKLDLATDALEASKAAADALRKELSAHRIHAARCYLSEEDDDDDDWRSPSNSHVERVHPEPPDVPRLELPDFAAPPAPLRFPPPPTVALAASILVASSHLDVKPPDYDAHRRVKFAYDDDDDPPPPSSRSR